MATYSKEFKENLIKLMLPPENKQVKDIASEYNIHQQTLYRWLREAKFKGPVYQDNPIPNPKRKTLKRNAAANYYRN